MSYESKKSGNVISNEDYKKLKPQLQAVYVPSNKKVPAKKKVEKPAEVKD